MNKSKWNIENKKVGSIIAQIDGYSFIIENISPNKGLGYPWIKSTLIFESSIYLTLEEAELALEERLKI